MSNEVHNNFTTAERGSAEGVAWSFPDKETLKPTLIGFNHSPLGDNQVRVKVLYFGVGDKDVQSLKSIQSRVLSPGNQVVGIIEAVGEKVGMRKIGDIVGVGFIRESCRNCKVCWSGKEQLCKNTQNQSSVRGFGTHINVSADWTFPIPTNIPVSETAPLLYSGVSAFSIVSSEHETLKLQLNRKARLAILGVGSIGHMAAKFGNHFGYQVTIFSAIPEEQQFLKENGINFEAFVPLNLDSWANNSMKFDVVIVATAIPNQILKRSIELPRRNGKLVFLTHSFKDVGIAGFSLVGDQRQVTGIRNGSKQDFYSMLELVSHVTSQNNKNLLPICEHFSFTEVEKALERVQSSTARYQCVVKVEEDVVSRFNKDEL